MSKVSRPDVEYDAHLFVMERTATDFTRASSFSAQALTRHLGRGIHVSPTGIQTRDTTDFHAEKSLGNDASAAALMVCGAKGSVYLALIAQERMAITVERLRAIRKSLRWRQPPAATRAP